MYKYFSTNDLHYGIAYGRGCQKLCLLCNLSQIIPPSVVFKLTTTFKKYKFVTVFYVFAKLATNGYLVFSFIYNLC